MKTYKQLKADFVKNGSAHLASAKAKLAELATPDTEEHDGMSNYETWCIATWIDNSQDLYTRCMRFAAEAKTTNALAINLKYYFEDEMPDLGATFWSDMLSAAFDEVNWYEIAAGLRNSVKGAK